MRRRVSAASSRRAPCPSDSSRANAVDQPRVDDERIPLRTSRIDRDRSRSAVAYCSIARLVPTPSARRGGRGGNATAENRGCARSTSRRPMIAAPELPSVSSRCPRLYAARKFVLSSFIAASYCSRASFGNRRSREQVAEIVAERPRSPGSSATLFSCSRMLVVQRVAGRSGSCWKNGSFGSCGSSRPRPRRQQRSRRSAAASRQAVACSHVRSLPGPPSSARPAPFGLATSLTFPSRSATSKSTSAPPESALTRCGSRVEILEERSKSSALGPRACRAASSVLLEERAGARPPAGNRSPSSYGRRGRRVGGGPRRAAALDPERGPSGAEVTVEAGPPARLPSPPEAAPSARRVRSSGPGGWRTGTGPRRRRDPARTAPDHPLDVLAALERGLRAPIP